MSRNPSTRLPRQHVTLTPSTGFYRARLAKGGPWLPARVTVENSRDDEGRTADRPRLVLYLAGNRYERGEIRRFWPLQPITEAEFRALSAAITETTGAALHALPPLF